MQNNFERDVRQKMNELKLLPSAAVWERVEVEIKEEKRKRRGLFWFLLAGLLLLGSGIFLYEQQASHHSSTTKEPAVQSPLKPVDEQANVYPHDVNDQSIGREKQNISSQQKTTTSTPRNNRKQSAAKSFHAQTKPSFVVQQNNPAVNKPPGAKRLQSGVVLQQKASPSISSSKPDVSSTISSTSRQTTVIPSTPVTVDSTTNKKEEQQNALPKVDSFLKKKIASASKWRRQLLFDAGISGYAEGPLFQGFNSGARNTSSFALNSGAPTTPTLAAQPSTITPGVRFSVGFAATKSLSKRWDLSFGLQYAYASTHQKVGDKKAADTAVQFTADKAVANGYYPNTGTNNYINRFHSIEVPVSLSFKPSLRWPLYVSMGAAYGRLLSTNALTFSSASNLYYENKANYLRNALSLSASAQAQFFGKKKTSLRTGPFVQYNLLKLRQENSNGTPHLLSAGLRTAVIF